MKKIAILFCFLVLSCSKSNLEDKTDYNLNSKILVFGQKNKVDSIVNNISFNEIKQLYKNYNTTLEDAFCYDGIDYLNSGNGNTGSNNNIIIIPKDDGSDGNGNMYAHFNTNVGDLFIGSDQDPDAIQRTELIGDVQCFPPYYEQNSYINIIIENSVNSNWRNAIYIAIDELNEVINNNPNNINNSILNPDTPNIYFRLADNINDSDYGNITIKVGNVGLGAIASAQVGNYSEIGNTGLYKHNVGTRVTISDDYLDYPFQYATTAIIHEIGHNLGFGHSNDEDQTVNIEGTTLTSNSFMNSVVHRPWNTTGFWNEDEIAFDKIFNVTSEFVIMDCNNNLGF